MLRIDVTPKVPTQLPENAADYYKGWLHFLQTLVDIIVNLPFFLLPLMIMIGGFMYLTSGGEEQKVQRSKMIIQWAFIGLIIYILAFPLVAIIAGTLLGKSIEPVLRLPGL